MIGAKFIVMCISMSITEYSSMMEKHGEKPAWTHELPDKTVIQKWENPKTGTGTIAYMTRAGGVCVLEVSKDEVATREH
jgi:hypothetical protein